MFQMRKGLVGIAFLVVAVLVGVGFSVLGGDDDPGPQADTAAQAEVRRAEAARSAAVDRLLDDAPVLGAELATGNARVVARTPWNEAGSAEPVGQAVEIDLRDPVDLPTSYRVLQPGDTDGDADAGALVATRPAEPGELDATTRLVVFVDLERDRIHGVAPSPDGLLDDPVTTTATTVP